MVERPAVLQTKQSDRSLMCPKYTFESGPRTLFPKEFFSWWTKHYQYQGSLVKNVKIRLIPKTNQSLEKFLIRKKPSRTMLTKMEPTHQ